MAPSGTIFFQDEYQVIYEASWQTVGGVIDFTSVVRTPFVWGEPPSGHIRNGVLFRRGIVTVERQVLRLVPGGYEVVADGVSQYEDDIQMNFPCQQGPVDRFKYHLNNPLVDDCGGLVSGGARWADPANANDTAMVWGDLDGAGSPVAAFTVADDTFAFIDVWTN